MNLIELFFSNKKMALRGFCSVFLSCIDKFKRNLLFNFLPIHYRAKMGTIFEVTNKLWKVKMFHGKRESRSRTFNN